MQARRTLPRVSGQPAVIGGGNVVTLLADDGGYLLRSLYSDGIHS